MNRGEFDEMVPLPAAGRVFSATRRVRLGDASPAGRLRLDACARYLQDVANDDSRDAGLPNPTAWVARRTVLRVRQFPQYLDMLTLRTWCSGLGPRWAERRYSVSGHDPITQEPAEHACIEATTLWVHVDMQTMKPIVVPADFASLYGEAAAGRTVSARLHLPSRPGDIATATTGWPLRFTDFDVLGHVNNAVYWSMVEQQMARLRSFRAPFTVTLDHHDAIDVGSEVHVAVADTDAAFDVWVTTGSGSVAAVARAIR